MRLGGIIPLLNDFYISPHCFGCAWLHNSPRFNLYFGDGVTVLTPHTYDVNKDIPTPGFQGFFAVLALARDWGVDIDITGSSICCVSIKL